MCKKTFFSIGRMNVEVQYPYSIDGRLFGYPNFCYWQEDYVIVLFLSFVFVYSKMPLYTHYIDGNFCGLIEDKYVTLFKKYGLVIVDDMEKKRVYVGIREKLWAEKSFYLIRSEINKHLLRFAFGLGTPLHAACMINDYREGILIVGNQGSGKSTFARYLLNSGFKLVNDDMILYDIQNNKVSGFKEGLYLRPEMLENLTDAELKKVQDIAHGRKLFIEAEEKEVIGGIPVKYTILIDRDFCQSTKKLIDYNSAYNLLINAHKNWVVNKEEKDKLNEAFSSLIKNTNCFYTNLQNMEQLVIFL